MKKCRLVGQKLLFDSDGLDADEVDEESESESEQDNKIQ